MHFGRQGLPMELLSDPQEHLYMILTKFGNNVGNLFAKKTNPKKRSNKMTEKQAAGAADDNSFHNEAVPKRGGGVGRSPLEIIN